ncbi:MAG: tetratricopeptide repeat protein, partial [Planctomycetaceae bacterium]|nr:tetratricopeptide repeat protein [Planctomycetaceae bacterium]
MTTRSLLNKLKSGQARHVAGDLPGAMAIYGEVLRKDRSLVQAWLLLGICYVQKRQLEEAESHFRQALVLAPGDEVARTQLANVLIQMGRGEESEQLCRELLDTDPFHCEASRLLASALKLQGELEAALHASSGHSARNPNDVVGLIQHAEMLMSAGRFSDALDVLTKARSIDGKNAQVYAHLCSVQSQLKQHDEALASLECLCQLDSSLINVLSTRGNVLLEAGRPDQAMHQFQRLIAQDPQSSLALNGLGRSLLALGYWSEAMDSFRLAANLDMQDRGYDSNFLYCATLNPSLNREQIAAMHLDWGQQIAGVIEPIQHAPGTDSERVLRIGYVSGDFRQHAAMRFFLPLLRHHRRDQFEIFLYSTSRGEDHVTSELRNLSQHWRRCCSMTRDELARKIQDDSIDILVDLSGHTNGNRLRVFAIRPAPLQVSLMGYPQTTGLQTMDYRITDRIRDNGSSANYFSETLVALPNGAACIELPADSPKVSDPPVLSNGFTTLGATHRIEKISSDSLQLWSAIMHLVPSARLLIIRDALANEQIRNRLVRALTDAGIPMDRVTMEWHVGREHLNVYSKIDILLDVFPWGASTTAFEAMWMGVPVPTIRWPEKLTSDAASLLHFSGCDDMIASDAESYVEITSRLAGDINRLASIRRTL